MSSGDSSNQSHDPSTSENPHEHSWYQKKSRILAAVVGNQVDVLIELLDSPKWCNIDVDSGNNYLQVAILRGKKEVFDYMLSIPDFPLEYINQKGQTALVVALDGFVGGRYTNEHFSYELVKKGACLDVVCFLGNTPLHCAVQRSYCEVVKLLLEKGVDPNALNSSEGETPIDLIPNWTNDFEEILSALLLHGAEPSLKMFEQCVMEKTPLFIQENLFFHLFDEYSNFEITFDLLFELVASPLFQELIKCPVRLKIGKYDMFVYFQLLCNIEIDYLKIIIEKFNDSLRQAFEETEPMTRFQMYQFSDGIDIKNLDLLVESNLKSAVMSFLDIWSSCGLERHLTRHYYNESSTTELYCYLLSYGFDIEEMDLQRVYEKFGYCELFKIFLHMDIKMGVPKYHSGNIMSILIYDVNMSLSNFFESPEKYSCVEKLLDYFASPKLKTIYLEKANRGLASKERIIPEMPLLVELARNTFRKFFIEKFQIKTTKDFYTLVKCLPISHVYKKIITYERKLY